MIIGIAFGAVGYRNIGKLLRKPFAVLIEVNLKISNETQALSDAQSINTALSNQLSGSVSLENVEQYAVSELGIPRNRQRIVRRTVTGKTAHITGRYRSCYFQRKRRTYTVYFCRQCDRTRRPRLNALRIAYFEPTVQLGAKFAYRIIRRTSVCINDLRPDFRSTLSKIR